MQMIIIPAYGLGCFLVGATYGYWMAKRRYEQ